MLDNSKDIAGKEFWDEVWEESTFLAPIRPYGSLNNYMDTKYHEFFKNYFSMMDTKKMKLLEIGCARSVWLPYFAKEYNFDVHGIDYSEKGCEQAREILKKERVNGTVICADMFRPPKLLVENFDVVISFGVVEHFSNTVDVIKAHAKFLKVGGFLIVANIPNLHGILGIIWPLFNRRFYETHLRLSPEILSQSFKMSDMELLNCDYFGVFNLNYIDLENKQSIFYKPFAHLRSILSKIVWSINMIYPFLKDTKTFSPLINCVGKKKSKL